MCAAGARSPGVSVGVVGGGIGGLSAALALLHAGFDVHVFERASQLGEVGDFPSVLSLIAIGGGVALVPELGLTEAGPDVTLAPAADASAHPRRLPARGPAVARDRRVRRRDARRSRWHVADALIRMINATAARTRRPV